MLNKSDLNYRTLVDEINDGIYICDLNSQLIYANQALACILGFEQPEEIIGKNFTDFLSPENDNILITQFRETISTGKGLKLFTASVLRKDGSKVTIEINSTVLIKDNKLVGNQGVVRDITEHRNAEKEIQYLNIHDSMTGLYNRTFFEAEMKRLERGRQFPMSIIVVCVRGKKKLDESEKPKLGDRLLKRIAQELFRSFRGDDIVARIGEDEFAVLLPNFYENSVNEKINRIQENLSQKITEQHDPSLQFFIGASTTNEDVGLNSVLKQAETIVSLAMKKHEIT